MSINHWLKKMEEKDRQENMKQFLPKNAKYKTLISQSVDVDIDEECEIEQESDMDYAVAQNNLVEKQQRHFNKRLNDILWKKEEALRLKHTYEEQVTVKNVNYEAFQKDWETVLAAKQKAEDVIMIGEPNGMFMVVDNFEKMTIH